NLRPLALQLVWWLALGWLAIGCTSPSGRSSTPKPGSGIAEYRKVARAAHRAVAATVDSLEGLALPPAQTSLPPSALPRFDKALRQLELTSVKARARAEAIIARGQAYFDEWNENLSSNTNRGEVRAETDRYQRLFDHYTRVRLR